MITNLCVQHSAREVAYHVGPSLIVDTCHEVVRHYSMTVNISVFECLCSEGGFFKAHLTFSKDYPVKPPKMKFVTEIWHPNSELNLNACILLQLHVSCIL